MPDTNALEGLLVRLLHHVGETLPSQSVVKGGLVLRLLDCPRQTNDLDVVLLPFGSKRDAAPLLEKALRDFPCDGVEIHVHSTAIRARIRQGGVVAQVEASVAETCPATPMTTSNLARLHGELPRIVQVMRFDVALAHKLGAWMERSLFRDLYDIYYWAVIQKTKPDAVTLGRRLATVRARKGKPRPWTMEELADSLDASLDTLTDDQLREELHAVLPRTEFAGLAARLRSGLRPFATALRSDSAQNQPHTHSSP